MTKYLNWIKVEYWSRTFLDFSYLMIKKLNLGKEMSKQRDFSENISTMLDKEIIDIVTTAENNATTILKNHLTELHNISEVLLDKETISGDDMIDIIKNGIPQKHNESDTPSNKKSRRSSKYRQ